jgi:predicted metal-dependent HD superfamily phosphohydrolase
MNRQDAEAAKKCIRMDVSVFDDRGSGDMAVLNQWQEMWARLGSPLPEDALFHDLTARYREPHRKYHTVQHLEECFEKLREIRSDAERAEEVELALWFHDAIYDVKRQDNEARSADWARSTVLAASLPAECAQRVHALVMATRHNAMPEGIDQQILIDVDLSILGSRSERFDEYERQIREEYSWVPGIVFRAKRRNILKEFLKRPTIFNTARFITSYESQARENLSRSIRQLER